MRHGERLWAGVFVFIRFVAALGVVCSTGLAGDTNVFVVKNTLQAGAPTQSGVKLLKFKSGTDPLLGTNATSSSTKLAIAVMDTDCGPGGLDPKIQLVAFNRTTGKIVATLVAFTTTALIFVGDNEIVLQAAGEGRDGVESADLDALITFGYEPCASARNPGDPASVEIDPLGFIRPNGTPGFNAPILPDVGSLEIVSDGLDNSPAIIPLHGTPTLEVADCNIYVTNMLDFGSVEVGSNVTKMVTIRNNGGTDCAISNVTSFGSSAFSPAAIAGFTLAPGASTNLDFTFAPFATGEENANVKVTSSDADAPEQIVIFAGSGTSVETECRLSVNTQPLNFGPVEIGTNKTLEVTVTNSGGMACNVDRVTVAASSPGFSVLTNSFEVGAGTSQVVSVAFTPVNTDDVRGTLEIDSVADDGSMTNLALVSLSATGIIAQCHLDIEPTEQDFGAVAIAAPLSLIQLIYLSTLLLKMPHLLYLQHHHHHLLHHHHL